MKTRTLILAGLAAATALSAGCAAVYRNANACEQTMRDALAAESSDTLKVAHTGVGIYGTRVVVEGSIERAASAVAAASAASAPDEAPAEQDAPEASAAQAASAAASTSTASAADAASSAKGKTKHGKPKPVVDAAAVECTYDRGGSLTAFRWLAPPDLAKTTANTDSND